MAAKQHHIIDREEAGKAGPPPLIALQSLGDRKPPETGSDARARTISSVRKTRPEIT